MKRQDVKSERGASLVEYALLIGAIAMAAIGGLSQVGGSVDERFTETGEAFQAVEAGSPTVDLEDLDEDEDEVEEPTAPDNGATGGGGSAEGGSGGDIEGPGPGDDDGSQPEGDEGGEQPDDGSDTDTPDGTGGSGGAPGDSSDPDVDPDDDGAGDGSGGDGSGGDGSGGDGSTEVSETVGLFGEFSVVFKVVDGKVVIGSVASHEWTYEIRKDNGQRIEMRFTNGQKGKNKKTVAVEAWLDKDGKLKTSVE